MNPAKFQDQPASAETAFPGTGSNAPMKALLRSILTASLIAAGVLCFTVGSLSSQMPRVVARPSVRETRDLKLPAAKLLCLTNENGSVQVYARAADDIALQAAIKAYKRSGADLATVQEYVASLIHVEADGASLHVVTEPEERPDTVDLRVDYLIMVPEGTNLHIEGSNGNVWISKGCGKVCVQGRNTDIEIAEPRGEVLAMSTNGRIRVLDAPQDTTIKTVNGNVYAHMIGGSLHAATTNGAIVARVLDPSVQECTLNSENGGITVVMEARCSANVNATTDRGVITSDFETDSSLGVRKRRHLKGMIGEGHTKLQMNTLNGNIWIAKGAL